MAMNWNDLQLRGVDPYFSYKSSHTNRLTYALSFDGRGVASGLAVSIDDPTTLQFTNGVALKDNVVLRWDPTFLMPLSESTGTWVVGDNWVVMVYKFIETKIENYRIARMDVIPIADYDPEWHLILARVTIDGSGNFISIDTSPPERPSIGFGSHNTLPGLQGGNPSLCEYYHLEYCDWQNVHACCWYVSGTYIAIDGSITPCCDISWDDNRITDLANPTSGGDAVNLQTLNTCIGCAGGATQFIQLTDTPTSYSADCWLKVNSGGDALEFVSAPSGGAGYLDDLCDVTVIAPTGGQFIVKSPSGDWTNMNPLLDMMCDVDTTGVAGGCVLCYNGTTNQWIPATVSGGGGATQLNDLTDVTVAGPVTSQFLVYEPSGQWNNMTPVVSIMGDVNTSGAVSGCVLCFNGTCWIPGTVSGGGGGGGGAFQEIADVVQETDLSYNNDFVFASPTLDYDFTHASRFFFNRDKGAFRAGYDGIGNWDDIHVGSYSAAFGKNTKACSLGSFSAGWQSEARGAQSISMGRNTEAAGLGAISLGEGTKAYNTASVALGSFSEASGTGSFAAGTLALAEEDNSVAIGTQVKACGYNSVALGTNIEVCSGADYSFGIGLDQVTDTISQACTMAIMGGYVGIETTTPAYELEVNGTVGATGFNASGSAGLDHSESINGKTFCWCAGILVSVV